MDKLGSILFFYYLVDLDMVCRSFISNLKISVIRYFNFIERKSVIKAEQLRQE